MTEYINDIDKKITHVRRHRAEDEEYTAVCGKVLFSGAVGWWGATLSERPLFRMCRSCLEKRELVNSERQEARL